MTDPSGAAVPRARVTATEIGTGFERSIATDDSGRYTVPSLRPTEYSLAIEVGVLPSDNLFYRDREQDLYLTLEDLTKRILDRVLFPKLTE